MILFFFLRFFPLQQTIEVSSRPVHNINFLQLKATLTGTVKCLPETDCSQASVTLKVLDGITIKTIQTKGKISLWSFVVYYFLLFKNPAIMSTCWKNRILLYIWMEYYKKYNINIINYRTRSYYYRYIVQLICSILPFFV